VAEPSQDMVLGCTSSRRSRRLQQAEVKAKAARVGSLAGSDMDRDNGSRTIRQCISGECVGSTPRGGVVFPQHCRGIRLEVLNQVMRKRQACRSWCSTATGEPGSRARCSSR